MHDSRAKEFASSWCALADARRLIAVAAGAAAGKFLHYEETAPAVAAQTAYGIEAEVEGYDDNYDAESMLFMDFRRHHTGLWPKTAHKKAPASLHNMHICWTDQLVFHLRD